MSSITVNDIFKAHCDKLQLKWICGQQNANLVISTSGQHPALLIGFLSIIRPNLIQVVGQTELQYFKGLGKNSLNDAITRIFACKPALVIMAKDLEPPKKMMQLAETSQSVLVQSSCKGNQIVEHIQYFLADKLSEYITLHGVFLEVLGVGVLLSGLSGIGKSELALELVTRGNRLIADDIIEFRKISPDTVAGTCPDILKDFIEVRGLGILNIRAMFGDNALINRKKLSLIINLQLLKDTPPSAIDRLDGGHKHRTVLDIAIPEITLPVAIGRTLAVIVEAAVRNHILTVNGYNASKDFITRQQNYIDTKTAVTSSEKKKNISTDNLTKNKNKTAK